MKSLIFILVLFSIKFSKQLQMSEKLENLRKQMKIENFTAYIIPSEDEHQSEYVSNHDKRRAYISGFSGSAGVAVVTEKAAALWTDNRYYLQAEKELDENWILMKASEPETLKIEDWLKRGLNQGDYVGQNAKLTSISSWQTREDIFKKSGIFFKSSSYDLIDEIWPSNEREPQPNTEIKIHEIEYSGLRFEEKIKKTQEKIKLVGADIFVVTALDECAWLFNIRGNDILYNPMFFSYAIIMANENKNHRIYLNQSRPNFHYIKTYLEYSPSQIILRNYNDITNDIKEFSDSGKKIWISPSSSYAIYNSVSNKNNLIFNLSSPIRSIKAVKNQIELQNIRECQIRDSLARIKHMYWLENEMKKGTLITEKSSMNELSRILSDDNLFQGLSFETISAFGKNAAVIHYATLEGDDSILTNENVYLLDAGAQYKDCTTDITRTHHFGIPSNLVKQRYTNVLQGSIDLNNIVWPYGVYGREADIRARLPLWKNGLDYGHGTGHGIGYFLSVHENPPTTSYNSRSLNDEPYAVGMITSDEPGYYEEGKFGIRLETDLEIVEANTKFHYRNRAFLKFNTLSLVPFEKNLIDNCLLTTDQVDWLNEYNKLIRKNIGPRLVNNNELFIYLEEKTELFKYAHAYSDCPTYYSKASISKTKLNILFLLALESILLICSFLVFDY